ncbi:MAG: hypothetical protein HZA92_14140 [Verrucomicrobia bacterium]|nr:hypothetical protein [Verrucomicrobiota bacterium]
MSTPIASQFLKALALLLTLLCAGSRGLRAEDLFTMSVAPGGTVVGGSSLLNLVDKIISGKDEFAFFAGPGAAYTGTLKYGTVQNAMSFDVTAPRTSATLNIPSIGFSQVFVGANQADLENKIENFLKKEGSAVYARFLKSMAAQSLVAVSDGNPNATTASAAAQSYQNYAMTFAETREEQQAATVAATANRVALGIMADVGAFNANGIKGTAYSLPMFARFKLTERVGLNIDLPLTYVDIDGAKVFGAGLSLGVPVKVVRKTKDSPWFWQLTPFAGGNISASKDLLAGGFLANGGLNSVVAHNFGPVTLSLGNHLSIHEGIPLTISSYKFDPGVSQQILKNGLKLDVPIGQRWIFDVYAIHTKFLSAAALDQYVTLGGEIGYRFGSKPNAAKKSGGYMKLGLYADAGEDFTSAHAQIGSSWKF